MGWRRAIPRFVPFGDGVFGASPLVLVLPFLRRGDDVLGAIGDGETHVDHHGLLALADLLVLLMLIVHLVLEVLIETKGLLEACSELGKPTLGLGGRRHVVGVITISLNLFMLVLGSTGAIPSEQVSLDGGVAHKMSREAPILSEEVTPLGLAPLDANQPQDVGSISGELAEKSTLTHLVPYVVHDVQLLAAALVEVSEHHDVDKEPIDFIEVSFLGLTVLQMTRSMMS